MDARGLDCIVLWGWPAVWDFCTANARYLSPIGGNAEFNVLVFPRRGDPTSFVMMPTFVEGWRIAQDWVADVRAKRGTWADTVADRLNELGLGGGRIGMDGLAGPLDPDGWLPHSVYNKLEALLPQAEFVNLDDMLESQRAIKSAEELELLGRAASLGDIMLKTCRDTARPGVRESEVYGGMMGAMIANGGEEPTLFLWGCDRYPYPHPFRLPTIRPIELGDLITCEIHPKIGGYFTHVERTFSLGPAEPAQRRIYDGCIAAYEEGMKHFGPGRPISKAMNQVRDVIRRSRIRHVRDRYSRPRIGVARISAIPPPCAQSRSGGAENDRRFVPDRDGVCLQHRFVRSKMARWQNRLRFCRNGFDHRGWRAPHAQLPDGIPGHRNMITGKNDD